MRRVRVLVALAALPAASVAAQRAGQFEVGAFGSFTRYDAAFGLANKVGGGARLGYYFGDALGLEADVLFQPRYTFATGSTSATMQPLIGGGSIVVNAVSRAGFTLFVLGGYSLLDFGTRAPFDFTDHAVHGGAGARLFLTNRVAVRVEGRAIYAPSTRWRFGSSSATHGVVSAGLSVFHLGRPPRDSDRDGVRDRKDACPNTPLGATVDPRGCPADGDQDAVYDGLDRCPTTAVGARVDADGCPIDADSDGVPDGIDQCPGTPQGALVLATGCPTDSDGDRVFDGIDQCADTPAGATVDPAGCPSDLDKDGVADGVDQCANTPSGALVDPKGCPLDSDVDGVADGLDKCPNTPSGTPVDPNGCAVSRQLARDSGAVRDSDGDGVPDAADRCPNTPLGSKVDAQGCIILFQPGVVSPARPGAPPRPTLILRGVHFETGKSVLTVDSYAILEQVAASLVANPDIRIEIAGYTDSRGSRPLNQRLSQARAGAVRAFLARKGVAPGRMIARGYGASGYIAPNTTAEGRALNRRVELHKLP